MSRSDNILWFVGISAIMGVSFGWSLCHAGPSGDGRSVVGPAALAMPTPAVSAGSTETGQKPGFVASNPWESSVALRTIPMVSQQLSVAGTTLMPYVGAGFGGGALTEYDRWLHAAPSALNFSSSANLGPRSLFGQHLIPNEVQLGVRFPF